MATLFDGFIEALSVNEGFLVLYSKLEKEQVSEVLGRRWLVELDGILSLQHLGMLALKLHGFIS